MRAPERRASALGGAIVLAAVGVCEHRVLDRVVRGRVWIGLVTFALLGIVTLQLALLQLNGSIGRALARKAQLMRANSALSIENSSLASGEHVMSAATQAGMVPVTLTGLRFLDARGSNVAHAPAALRAPVLAASESAAAAGSASESASPASSGSEASQQSESSSSNLSSSSSSSASESASSSEASQSTNSSHGAEAAPSAGAGESSASHQPASAEAGGSSAGGGG